jgi:hypothetical protein
MLSFIYFHTISIHLNCLRFDLYFHSVFDFISHFDCRNFEIKNYEQLLGFSKNVQNFEKILFTSFY